MKNAPLIISVLALFVALGGTGYAAVKINGKDIKKGTVSGKALKKNTLTGTQIKESRLGKVPAAASADSAATSSDSAKLGGLGQEAFVKGNAQVLSANATVAGSTTTMLLDLPGLARLSIACNSANEAAVRLTGSTAGVNYVSALQSIPTNVPFDAGTLNNNASVTFAYFSTQKFDISLWLTGDTAPAYEINGSTLGCKTTATAVGHG